MENFPRQTVRVKAEELADRQRFLMNNPPFQFLPRTEIEIVAANLTQETYIPGLVLFTQEETIITHILIVKSGSLERIIEQDGKQRIKEVLETGRAYGGISLLFNNGISTSTLRCMTEVTVYRLDRENFFRLCIKSSAFARFFSSSYDVESRPSSGGGFEEIPELGEYGMHSSFLSKTVAEMAQAFPSCTASTSIREAARLLTASRRSAILVTDDNQEPKGLITDYDLRKKVIVDGRDPDGPAGDIMTTPLLTIDADSQVFEAVLTMMRKQVKHLALQVNGTTGNVITERDIFLAQTLSPVFLVKEMNTAQGLEGLKACYAKLPMLIGRLIENGARSTHLNSIITALTDEMLVRVMNMALESAGPPPVKFAFLLFGSEGRREQTLKTDQDNGIVFEDVPKNEEEYVRRYFLDVGNRVCDWLHEIGQTHCEFDIMAKNPTWCQPLSRWQDYHRKWIESDDPERLLKAGIFFDFRLGYGQEELVNSLHKSLFKQLKEWPGFLRHMAQNIMHVQPPLSFFGNFVLEEKGERKGGLDIKSAMRLVVDFARIYALQGEISETNTTKRLEAVFHQKSIDKETLDNLAYAYEYLMHQRLKHQVTVMSKKGASPDNYLQPAKLTHIERQALKEAFKRIRTAQGKLRLDFFLHFP
ncbi:MAG: DUF294 nucleotidyltransferase-like domain-containing protein [Desulfosalsimonadaceae bacterium]